MRKTNTLLVLLIYIIAFFGTAQFFIGERWFVTAVLASDTDPAFTEKSEDVGLVVEHGTPNAFGFTMRNLMVSGAAAADFNQDGWTDLFVLGGGNITDTLHINNGDGTFREEAANWGVGQRQRGSGVAIGDFNSDGWPDMFVTTHGITQTAKAGYHRLYKNNGDGTFSDIAAFAGIQVSNDSGPDGYGSAFGDYDLDGDLDLFVTGWEPGDTGNRLYQNNGDETFSDVTIAAGVETTNLQGFSPCFADMNGDRFPELLIAGDFNTTKYFVNKGDGTFSDQTVSSGTDKPAHGMGAAIGDLNNDGLLDWYISSIYEPTNNRFGNRLYMNQGADTYQEIASTVGVDSGHWGWGTIIVDFNHDGWLDIAETNGWSVDKRFAVQPNRLWLNQHDGTYKEVAETVGFAQPIEGRGLIHLDADNDGDQDIVITNNNGMLNYYQNNLASSNANWLKIRLDTSNRPDLAPNGRGARIRARAGSLMLTRSVNGCSTYLSQSELTAHLGLADASKTDSLIIEWPDGQQTTLQNVSSNTTMTIQAPFKFHMPLVFQ